MNQSGTLPEDNYVSKLLTLMRETQVGVIANPLINITQQGRHDTHPKRRDMTRVPEQLAHGLACGADDEPIGHAPML